jgi:ATP-dependent Zn protease
MTPTKHIAYTMKMKKLTYQEVSEHWRNVSLEHTAYHEAGHAVIALRLGYEVKKVKINPIRKSGRATIPSKRSPDDIKIYLAGPLAEALVNPTPFNEKIQLGARFDWRDVRRSVREFVALGFIDGREKDILIEELFHETKALVHRDRKAIAAVAEALLERNTLTGDDIARIVEAV